MLDHFLSELDRRFSNSNLELIKSLDACNPSSSQFLDSILLSDLASRYDLPHELLPNESLLAKRALQGVAETVLEVYHELLKLQTAFPTLTQIFKIALTIVVSTAQCERSFSALTRIKTHLRTTMTDQRLADISLLSIERDLMTGSTFFEDTIRGLDNNRTIILSKLLSIKMVN